MIAADQRQTVKDPITGMAAVPMRNEKAGNNRREYLISAAIDFASAVSHVEGVLQIAVIGSLTTNKADPKDVDVLLTIAGSADIEKLAKLGRMLKGKTQSINSGADIFLMNADFEYLGRTCHFRDCRPGIRMSCQAMNCGRVPYLCDDLQIVSLPKKLMKNPPLVLYPKIVIRDELPEDLMNRIKKDNR